MWPLSLHKTVSHQSICVTEKSPSSFISSAQKALCHIFGFDLFPGAFVLKVSADLLQAGGAEEQNSHLSFEAD